MMNASLSPQQHKIVLLVAQGLTDKAIANRLGLAQRTVRDYLSQACVKVGAVNRTNLVFLATARGLIKLDTFTIN